MLKIFPIPQPGQINGFHTALHLYKLVLQTDFKGMVATWAPKNWNILAHT